MLPPPPHTHTHARTHRVDVGHHVWMHRAREVHERHVHVNSIGSWDGGLRLCAVCVCVCVCVCKWGGMRVKNGRGGKEGVSSRNRSMGEAKDRKAIRAVNFIFWHFPTAFTVHVDRISSWNGGARARVCARACVDPSISLLQQLGWGPKELGASMGQREDRSTSSPRIIQ